MLVVKACQDLLMPHIKALFSLICNQCKFPNAWKLNGQDETNLKKRDKSNIQNYRPISNLNSITKIFERCILNRLPDNIDGPNQHGFMKEHSTTSAGLEIQSTLAGLIDRRKTMCYILS